jgi:hypothetical protein
LQSKRALGSLYHWTANSTTTIAEKDTNWSYAHQTSCINDLVTRSDILTKLNRQCKYSDCQVVTSKTPMQIIGHIPLLVKIVSRFNFDLSQTSLILIKFTGIVHNYEIF